MLFNNELYNMDSMELAGWAAQKGMKKVAFGWTQICTSDPCLNLHPTLKSMLDTFYLNLNETPKLESTLTWTT